MLLMGTMRAERWTDVESAQSQECKMTNGLQLWVCSLDWACHELWCLSKHSLASGCATNEGERHCVPAGTKCQPYQKEVR